MFNTLKTYEELSRSMAPEAAHTLVSVFAAIYEEQQNAVTKVEFNELRAVVRELAEAQKRTEEVMQAGFRDLHNRFGVLGARWGDSAEETFRRGLLETVSGLGFTVEHYHGQDPDGFINYTPRSFDRGRFWECQSAPSC